MRTAVNNNYGFITVDFAYHGGTGYAIAYSGRTTERIWMPAASFSGCKSRDEAELKALLYLVNGSKTGNYKGFNKNARITLHGFDAFEKGVRQNHKANTDLWAAVLKLFASGRDGLRFDLIQINDTFSSAIQNASTYKWTAENREMHNKWFVDMVSKAQKTAKSMKKLQAKTEKSAIAKVEKKIEAKTEKAPEAKVERDVCAEFDALMAEIA